MNLESNIEPLRELIKYYDEGIISEFALGCRVSTLTANNTISIKNSQMFCDYFGACEHLRISDYVAYTDGSGKDIKLGLSKETMEFIERLRKE